MLLTVTAVSTICPNCSTDLDVSSSSPCSRALERRLPEDQMLTPGLDSQAQECLRNTFSYLLVSLAAFHAQSKMRHQLLSHAG